MFNLIVYVILAIVFAYFSTQNTNPVSLTLATYKIENIPVYIVLGVTLLIGLLFSWLHSLVGGFTSSMKIIGKENIIKDERKAIHELTKKVNELQLENARLTGALKSESKDPNSI